MFIFLLQQRVIDLERQCWANAQYSRRDCLEVAGIPESVKQNELEDKVLRIFKKVGCDIPTDNIKACHRVRRHNNHHHQIFEMEGLPTNIFGKKRPEQTGYEGNRLS